MINLTKEIENILLSLMKKGCKIKVLEQNYLNIENSYILKVRKGSKQGLFMLIDNKLVAGIQC
jgi:hypothetical protein